MTYKQPDGLDPRRYKNRTGATVSRSFVRRGESGQVVLRERRAAVAQVRTMRRVAVNRPTGGRGKIASPGGGSGASERLRRPGGRVVTMPHEAVPEPMTWAERHARYRARANERDSQVRLVPRTLAQTGRPAAVGQMRVKPLPRSSGKGRTPSRVPSRSGKLRARQNVWRRLWAFLFILALIAGGISYALLSPTFRIQQVEIRGTQNQKLEAAIRGLGLAGQNIFLLNQGSLARKLESLPPVAVASLSVQLPDTVLVDVQERVPVLLWQVGKTTYALAQDGTVIAPQSDVSGTGHLALVIDARSSGGAKVRPGTRLSSADIAFVEQVFAQAPAIAGVAPFSLRYVDRISEDGHQVPANVAGSGSYVLVSDNGWRAYLGDAQNSSTLTMRLEELQQILQLARQQNVQIATIDLRFGLRPTYTLKA